MSMEIRGIKELTIDLVNDLNAFCQNRKVIIVFPNTKGLNRKLIERLNSNIIISISGGYEQKKKKYISDHYQKRTYYSPKELSSIIEKFEQIEANIDPSWSETQKCIYVYKVLCEYCNYQYDSYLYIQNGRDVVRNLMVMLSGEGVCAGFAIVFKEAMDRLGIECVYQNIRNTHSWNVVKLDGNYYGIDLTWDICSKSSNTCGFQYFGTQDSDTFYNFHNINGENDETRYHLSIMNPAELININSKIDQPKINSFQLKYITNQNGENVGYYKMARMGENEIYIITFDNKTPYMVSVSVGLDLGKVFTKTHLINILYDKSYTYVRDDESAFLVISTGRKIAQGTGNYNEVLEHYYYIINRGHIYQTHILSENDLSHPNPCLIHDIANLLLTNERVEEKIKRFKGYVGFVYNGHKYYTEEIEARLGCAKRS